MGAIRLNPEQQQHPYSLMIRRTGTGERELTIEISCHADRRAALNALYDHIHLMARKGFTCERVSLLHWKAQRQDPDKLIQCVVFITQEQEVALLN